MKIRTFEEELERIEPTIKRLTTLFLLGKKVVVKGKENFVKTGPSIIVGNHIGSFKDIVVLFKIVPRPIFFSANEMIFAKDKFEFLIKKHLKRHLKQFGLFLNLILAPLKAPFVRFITTNIAKIGTIPVDFSSGYQRKRAVLRKWEEYLLKGKAIVILQGRGRVMKKDPNPYVCSFKKGFAIIVSHLFSKGILIPVTPVALLGTQIPWLMSGKIKINVGQPIYPTGAVEDFRNALEQRTKALLIELLK